MKLGTIHRGPNVEELAKAYAIGAHTHFFFEHELGGSREDVEAEVNCMARCHAQKDAHLLIVTLLLTTGLSEDGLQERVRKVKAYVDYDGKDHAGVVYDTIDDVPE